MGDPRWYDRLPRWAKHLVDQVLHALAGSAISALVGGISTISHDGLWAGLMGAFVSSAIGGLRELVQNWGDTNNNDGGNWLDWAVWTLAAIGPALAYWRWT